MSHWYKAIDKNHPTIREDFRNAGWPWWDTHRLGGGFPDGLTMCPETGRLYVIEVKVLVGKKHPKPSTSGKAYTKKNQEKFSDLFPVSVICTVEAASAFRRRAVTHG